MSNSYDIEGTIINIGDVETFGENFTTRTFVIKTDDPQYPQEVPIELKKEKVDDIKGYAVGQKVKVFFNIRGRYWEKGDKYFSSLECWRLSAVNQPSPNARPTQPDYAQESMSDIPF